MDPAQCMPYLDDFRVYMTFIFVIVVAAAIWSMVNLTLPEKEPPVRNGYWCRRHGCPEDECREKHGPGEV